MFTKQHATIYCATDPHNFLYHEQIKQIHIIY